VEAKSSLGDAESSLGDAKSSLGDAKRLLGDANSSLGDATRLLGDAKSSLGDATSSLGDAKSSLGDAKSSLDDAKSSLGDAKSLLGDAESSLGDAKSLLGDAKSSLGDAESSLGDVQRMRRGPQQRAAVAAGGNRHGQRRPVAREGRAGCLLHRAAARADGGDAAGCREGSRRARRAPARSRRRRCVHPFLPSLIAGIWAVLWVDCDGCAVIRVAGRGAETSAMAQCNGAVTAATGKGKKDKGGAKDSGKVSPRRVSLTVYPSPSLPLCLSHRLSHCASRCVLLTVSPPVPLSPSLPLCLSLCPAHRLSPCASLTFSPTVPLAVSCSPSLPLCLSHRLSHCASRCVLLTVSPTVSSSQGSGGGGKACAKCTRQPRGALLLPCGHTCLCFACATAVAGAQGSCPTCGGKVTTVHKAHLE
jgi:hypothetical protein